MREPIKYRLTWLLIVTILAIVFGMLCTSCSVLHKTKSVSKSDSTSEVKEKVDSVVKKDSLSVHKSTTTETLKKDSSKTDEHTTIDEETTKTEFDTSGKVKAITVTKKKTDNQKSTGIGSIAWLLNHSDLDSSKDNSTAELHKAKDNKTAVKTVQKDKEVKRSFISLWWFLLLLIPVGYYVYNNRDKIWRWVLKITTGV